MNPSSRQVSESLIGLAILVAVALSPGQVSAELEQFEGQWVSHGGDLMNHKYSPLSEITSENFNQLEIQWRWRSVHERIEQENRRVRGAQFKPTPLAVDGRLYLVTPACQVVALDAGTGELIWEFDPQSYLAGRPANVGFQHRGAAYWADGEDKRILVATHDRKLWAINAETGTAIEDFGEGGFADLENNLDRKINPREITHSSPPIICRDTVVVGSIVSDIPLRKEAAPGHVRGFDVRTGEMKWIFHTIPQAGEFGVETWEDESWAYSGATNVWSMFAADEELGTVYLPTATPTNDMYGGHRLGDNLFAESMVCLDADTGKRIWHFQAVHHGLWDYDFPTAPNLVDIVVDGKPIKAIAQVSKQAFCYVLDRVTGEPVWPIEEREVPASTVPGERASPTQPFPTRPAPFDRQGLTSDDLLDFTPELQAEMGTIMENFTIGPIFTPPTAEGMGKPVLFMPGSGGGANWPGAAVDPETGILYVPSVTRPSAFQVTRPDPHRSNFTYVLRSWLTLLDGPQGLPITKPPYARVTAIDLNTGDHVWMTPLGDGPINHPSLEGLALRNLGALGVMAGGGGPLVTRTLLIVGQTASTDLGTQRDKTPKLNFFDKQTGEWLGMVALPGDPYGNPISYAVDGKQYLAVAVGGGNFLGGRGPHPAELIVLGLP